MPSLLAGGETTGRRHALALQALTLEKGAWKPVAITAVVNGFQAFSCLREKDGGLF